MRIVCTNCNATYSITSARIPEAGKAVKCASCGKSWIFTPGDVVGTTKKAKAARVTKRTARVEDNSKSAIWDRVLLILVMIPLLVLFSSSFQKNMPYRVRKIYRLMEIYDTTDIRLVESHIHVVQSNKDNMVVRLSWTIENAAKEERFIPGVYFSFYNQDAKKVFSKQIVMGKYGLIPSNTKLKFEKLVSGVPTGVKSIKVKTGSALEALFY